MNDVPFNAHPDLQRAVIFHGHWCPGLTIGYRASQIALDRLGVQRTEDEQLVAIVENDSCATDAIQVITGCTFGKGNLVFRDHGKHVYTFAVRPSGRAVRLSLRVGNGSPGDEVSRDERARWLLESPAEDVFRIEALAIDLPPTARVRESVACDGCGEPVMETRAVRRDGRTLCRPCFEADRSHA